jgi:uncharacterized Zn-finger protein
MIHPLSNDPVTQPVRVATPTAACDGDVAQGLGHPRVFLDLGPAGAATCPYCSRLFLRDPDAAAGGGH